MGHCVYYACIMQGTASLAEDRRQPPYLCPIDLAKLRQAMNEDVSDIEWEEDRYRALQGFCEGQQGQAWAAFQEWLQARLDMLS